MVIQKTRYQFVGTRKILWIGGRGGNRGITIPKDIEKYLDIKDNTHVHVYFSPEKRRLLLQFVDLGTFIDAEEIDIPAEMGTTVVVALKEALKKEEGEKKKKEKGMEI